MDPSELQVVAESFWEHRLKQIYFPEQWFGKLSLADGYQVQLALLDRLIRSGSRQAGWKVGLTSDAMQQQFSVPEPVFGYLLDEGVHESPVTLEFARLIQPGIENEICVTLGSELRGPGITAEEARSAIASVRPAMELVETRGPLTQHLAVALAENIQQKGVILGRELRPVPDDLDLSGVHVVLRINGAVEAEAAGAAALGDPLRSIAWIANKLAEYGRALEPGQLVMTGSLTRQFSVSAGDELLADWNPLGPVEARFV